MCVQASVIAANLLFIVWLMLPSFSRQVAQQVPRGLPHRYYLVAFPHDVVPAAAELLGIYVVLVADAKVIPVRCDSLSPTSVHSTGRSRETGLETLLYL